MGSQGSPVKSYDYLLKFLLVGDSDVGKGEILDSLQDGSAESPYAYSSGIDYKTTTILLDGRRVKLELWDTSGQGRFCTIFRSYSRGAQVRNDHLYYEASKQPSMETRLKRNYTLSTFRNIAFIL
uniref:small monomeric GTPase n=1 Tax=Gouania willdenowi TaxID=441366 RepID=A0A8C5N4Y7_GOUWI